MPMLKKPSGTMGVFQSPRPSLTSPPPPPPSSRSESENISPEDAVASAEPCVSAPIAKKPSFSLHKNYTTPANIKHAQPAAVTPLTTQAPFKCPTPSLHPTPSGSSAPPLKKPANFAAPRQSDSASLVAQEPPAPAVLAAPERIFACMFTKVSKKKHKTWADGFIVLNMGTKKLTLKDTEGKDVGKMGWQSPSFTSDLKSGSVMNYVCGYDLELCQEIEFSHYISGQCFLSKSKKMPTISSVAVVSGLKATPFLAHSDGSSSSARKAAPLYAPLFPQPQCTAPWHSIALLSQVQP